MLCNVVEYPDFKFLVFCKLANIYRILHFYIKYWTDEYHAWTEGSDGWRCFCLNACLSVKPSSKIIAWGQTWGQKHLHPSWAWGPSMIFIQYNILCRGVIFCILHLSRDFRQERSLQCQPLEWNIYFFYMLGGLGKKLIIVNV